MWTLTQNLTQGGLHALDMSAERRKDILIVDDMPDHLRVLIEILGARHYNVRPALNGQQALTSAQATPPDLILLDIMMPGIDGYEVCKRLKADARTRDIPVIFISALEQTSDKVRGFAAGGVDFITKPFHSEEALARVELHLSKRELERRLEEELARRKESEERLQQVNLELQEAIACKDKFFSIIAHDLRNPLGSFRDLSEMILEKSDSLSKSDILRLVKMEFDSTKRMFALLDDLLMWAKSQQNKIEFYPQNTDLAEIIAYDVGLLTLHAQEKQITLKNSVAAPLWGHVDAQMMQTTILNVLSNAVKFTETGGTVEISARADERAIEITVSDTGVGIPPNYLERLFRIDARSKRRGTNNETGTGLGLILCKEFIERHGGSIGVESEAGNGTTVRMTLPVKKLSDALKASDSFS